MWSAYSWCLLSVQGLRLLEERDVPMSLFFQADWSWCQGCTKAVRETTEMQNFVQGEVGWLEGQQGWDETSSLAQQGVG